mmetsp:Transcript_22232/g.51140  ORF Transcript_22232/g.51140 Transcript_22232/m.51140 type:complete len:252 (-) Transcript_22232:369-1124(-)
MEVQRVEDGRPILEFAHPVRQRRLGGEYKKRPLQPLHLAQPAQQRDALQRLAEPHLVGKNPRDAVLVEVGEPAYAIDLVLAQLAEARVDQRRLLCQTHLLLKGDARAAAALLCAHHFLVLFLLRLAAPLRLVALALQVLGEAEVLEDVGLLQEEVEARLRRLAFFRLDDLVLLVERHLRLGLDPLLLRLFGLCGALFDGLLKPRALLRALELAFRRARRRLLLGLPLLLLLCHQLLLVNSHLACVPSLVLR